jgi:hypothetical protein
MPDDPDFFRQQTPALQLFDNDARRWVEFEEMDSSSSYMIANPERYVNSSGGVLFRFVNRNAADEFGMDQAYFQLLLRLEGTIS